MHLQLVYVFMKYECEYVTYFDNHDLYGYPNDKTLIRQIYVFFVYSLFKILVIK